MTASYDVDVLVVGAGPTGLTAAALLARAGVQILGVSKYGSTADSPRAHITNQRTVEIMRDLGVESQVVDLAMPQDLMATHVIGLGFKGQELARVPSWGGGTDRVGDYAKASPCKMCNIPQHQLEPIVYEAAQNFGANIDFNNELIDIQQDDEGVDAIVLDRLSGATRQLRARYVIAADGGRSTVASLLGCAFEGASNYEAAYSIWIEADLTKYARHRSGSLFFTVHPGMDVWLSGFACVKPWTEWLVGFYMNEGDVDGTIDVDDDALRARISQLIGDPDVDVRIKRAQKWFVNQQVAESYRHGRVFLAGDAAHRHPPANGLGSNTCIQDSYNLAWKLALVIQGKAKDTLLDSYDAERKPVGRQVIDRAMKSLRETQPFISSLGIHGRSAEDGYRSLEELFGPTSEGERRRSEMVSALSLLNWQFNAHGVELGQHYTSAAVVSDGSLPPVPERDPELYYTPSTYPGRYLPHVWLDQDGEKASTLDLCDYEAFTLLVGVSGDEWIDAAKAVSSELGLSVNVRKIGLRQPYDDVWAEWTSNRQVSDRGCVLVRPDRYVAWRSSEVPAEGAVASLRSVLLSITGR